MFLKLILVANVTLNGFETNFGSKYVIKWVDTRPKNHL